MSEDQAGEFDNAWNRRAEKAGLGNNARLPYAQAPPQLGYSNKMQAENRGLAAPEQPRREAKPLHESRGLMAPPKQNPQSSSSSYSEQARSGNKAANPSQKKSRGGY